MLLGVEGKIQIFHLNGKLISFKEALGKVHFLINLSLHVRDSWCCFWKAHINS